MHKRLLVVGLTALVVGLGAVAARAAASEETVPLSKVPAAVRATIEKHAEGAKIVKVEVVTEKGKKVYDIEIQNGGKTSEFSVSPEGKYLGVKADEDGEKGEGEKKDEAKPEKGEKAAVKLPDAAMKTFKKVFSKGEITKLDVDQENGVTVYDIEFKDGAFEKETDITADGTMLESTIVVEAKAVPKAVMQAIQKAAKGSKIGRLEQIEISYETKDGKAIKLPKPITHYAAELSRDSQTAEVVVGPDGKVLEPAKWGEAKGEKKEGKEQKGEGKAKESNEALKKAPAAVQATVKKLVGKGKIVEFALEKDGNYELDYQVPVTKAAIIAPDGKIKEREETIEVSALPKAVAAAAKKLYPGGKIEVAETSTTDKGTVYELKVVVGKQSRSVTVSLDGKVQEAGKAEKEEAKEKTGQKKRETKEDKEDEDEK